MEGRAGFESVSRGGGGIHGRGRVPVLRRQGLARTRPVGRFDGRELTSLTTGPEKGEKKNEERNLSEPRPRNDGSWDGQYSRLQRCSLADAQEQCSGSADQPRRSGIPTSRAGHGDINTHASRARTENGASMLRRA